MSTIEDPRWYAEGQMGLLERRRDLYAAGGLSARSALDAFTKRFDNLRQAQAWAATMAEGDVDACKLCSDFPIVGADLLILRQHPSETEKWLKAALKAAAALGDKTKMALLYQHLGNVYEALSQSQQALGQFEKALALAREENEEKIQDEALGGSATHPLPSGRSKRLWSIIASN